MTPRAATCWPTSPPGRRTTYPARAAPPPEALATAQLSAADLFLVFASTASIEAHLALVDQEPIRAAIDRARETAEWPALETLIKTRYAQHYAARARSAEDRRPLQKQPPAPISPSVAKELERIRAGMRGEMPLEDSPSPAQEDAERRHERNKRLGIIR